MDIEREYRVLAWRGEREAHVLGSRAVVEVPRRGGEVRRGVRASVDANVERRDAGGDGVIGNEELGLRSPRRRGRLGLEGQQRAQGAQELEDLDGRVLDQGAV